MLDGTMSRTSLVHSLSRSLLGLAVSIALVATSGCGDGGGADSGSSPDFTVPVDAAVLPDLAAPDLTVLPDLLPPPDLTPPPDLALKVEWSARQSGTTKFLHALWGSSKSDLFVAGEGGTILHSSDGTTWTPQASGTAVELHGLWGSGAADVFAVGEGGTILHYDGKAWSALPSGVKVALRGVGGNNAMDVYAVGDGGTILHTEDGGKSWPPVPPLNPPVVTPLRKVVAIGQAVWAAGDAGNLIIHTDHFGPWAWILRNISSPENVYGLYLVSANPISFWTAADDGSLRYSFDGLIWPRQNGAPLTPMRDIWGSSSDDVYAVGDGGVIHHLAKLHAAFAPQGSGTTRRLDAVWGSSASDVYAVGEAGTILHHP